MYVCISSLTHHIQQPVSHKPHFLHYYDYSIWHEERTYYVLIEFNNNNSYDSFYCLLLFQ